MMKSRPAKPGNGVEDKTEMTRQLLVWGPAGSKALRAREGVKLTENLSKEMRRKQTLRAQAV